VLEPAEDNCWREQIRAVSAVRRREEIGGTGQEHMLRRRFEPDGSSTEARLGEYFEKLRQVRFLQGLDGCRGDGQGSSFRIVSILAIRSANS